MAWAAHQTSSIQLSAFALVEEIDVISVEVLLSDSGKHEWALFYQDATPGGTFRVDAGCIVLHSRIPGNLPVARYEGQANHN